MNRSRNNNSQQLAKGDQWLRLDSILGPDNSMAIGTLSRGGRGIDWIGGRHGHAPSVRLNFLCIVEHPSYPNNRPEVAVTPDRRSQSLAGHQRGYGFLSGNHSLFVLVGARGFEPPASASRTLRSTRLSHAPTTSEMGSSKARYHTSEPASQLYLVPKVGVEPTRGHPQSLLRRSCLPFHHFGPSAEASIPGSSG